MLLSKFGQNLGNSHRVSSVSQSGGAVQILVQSGNFQIVGGTFNQCVFRNVIANIIFAQLATQSGVLSHGQAAVICQHHGGIFLQPGLQLSNLFFLLNHLRFLSQIQTPPYQVDYVRKYF